ncbi:phosphoglycerate mutase-like protein [Boletus edulis BED1]|uniref:Phosphoglycerate mutase-like protein n=1 Tax=Boletus edulis BED1 TaxID=1328754 RepID=A0AAD4GC90_BOLED|nr:phosphoglycerate mutase-like protein [Boletus edulis BED1]
MYLPPESLLRLLQLPLSLLNSDQPTPHPEVSDGKHHGHKNLNNLGNLSPYHDASTVHGASADLPEDCTIDQVILLHRHGSRGPTGEQDHILELANTLEKAWDIIQSSDLPPYLKFLKQGYKYDLVPEELTIVGRKELFDHGVEFSFRYPTFSTKEVVSTNVQRVIDSAHFFSQGFFGRGAENVTFLTTDNFTDPVSWLVPWESCPKLSYVEPYEAAQKWAKEYIPPIVERLNGLIPGVGFFLNATRGALYGCPYDLAARGKSPWCGVFTARELRGLEYELDLFLDGYSGHASKGDPGPLVGAFYIKKLIERLTSKDAEPLYLDFAHDITILFALSTLDLNKDAVPLSPFVDHPPAHRKFRSSNQTPFAAEMVWEKFTCKQSFEGPQVRLVLNGVTFPLSICQKCGKDKKYGTCSLNEFVRANEYSRNVEYHSQIWNATCELDH